MLEQAEKRRKKVKWCVTQTGKYMQKFDNIRRKYSK